MDKSKFSFLWIIGLFLAFSVPLRAFAQESDTRRASELTGTLDQVRILDVLSDRTGITWVTFEGLSRPSDPASGSAPSTSPIIVRHARVESDERGPSPILHAILRTTTASDPRLLSLRLVRGVITEATLETRGSRAHSEANQAVQAFPTTGRTACRDATIAKIKINNSRSASIWLRATCAGNSNDTFYGPATTPSWPSLQSAPLLLAIRAFGRPEARMNARLRRRALTQLDIVTSEFGGRYRSQME